MKRVLSISLFFILFALCPVNANELSLQSATQKALSDNPSLSQIQARYEAMKEIPSQKSSLPDPVLSIGGMNFPTDTFDRSQEAMTQVTVGFSQSFPFPGKLDLKEEIADFEARAALYAVDELRLRLINNVSKTWWQIFYFDRALDTVNVNQTLLRQLIEVAKTKYQTGKGLQQDVLLSQLELSKLINQKIQIKALRKNEDIKLHILMGNSPLESIILEKDIDKNLAPLKDEKSLYLLAEKFRPILKLKEQKISASTSRVNLAKKDYYPDFKVSVLYGSRIGHNAIGEERSDLFSMMLGIKIPLYAASKQDSALQEQLSKKQANTFALSHERLKMMENISKARNDYRQYKEQLLLFETGIIPQAKQTLDSMLSGYQVDKVDFLNLVRSQVTLFNYELQYWKALAQAKQALLDVQAYVGEENIYE
ncbi:MAG: transporter [Arcobacter sp.]|nr:MAG: transporter [Arcobacter sp.]